jgi:hypothetical protein
VLNPVTPAGSSTSIKGEAEFRGWLQQNTALGTRAQSDVCSRVRRVAAAFDITECRSEHELRLKIKASDNFAACSTVVRAGLKRACKLYLDFLAGAKFAA